VSLCTQDLLASMNSGSHVPIYDTVLYCTACAYVPLVTVVYDTGLLLCVSLCTQDLLGSMNQGSHVPGALDGIPVPYGYCV